MTILGELIIFLIVILILKFIIDNIRIFISIVFLLIAIYLLVHLGQTYHLFLILPLLS